jgi:signal transduction histidine kinase
VNWRRGLFLGRLIGADVRKCARRGAPPRGQRNQALGRSLALNLIVNAIEAMSGGAEGARDLLMSTGKVEPDAVSVAVRDSGPGLDPANPKRVFDPFYTTKPGGLGMGLSICRTIIEAHGGRLWASTSVPRGAIFQFTLPVGGEEVSLPKQTPSSW